MFHWYTDRLMHGLQHFMFTYHCYSCMSCFYITVTHACVVSLFLSYGSLFILHVLLFHVTVFMLYDCFLLLIWISRYWTWELLICDMWNPTFIVPVILFPFPVILFLLYCSRFSLYCSTLSTELWSSYHVTRIMYSSYSCYIVYLI